MIYLILDFILAYFTKVPTFFFLINLVLIKKQEFPKLIIITLILDLLILNSYFLNTIIISIIFLVFKRLKIRKISLKNYILSLGFIYLAYIIAIGLINKFSIFYITKFILNNISYQFIFYILMYKIEKNYIELSR